MKFQKNSFGFTLVELLAVIAIIALLFSFFFPSLQHALDKAKQVKCKSNLRTIGMAMISFADDHNGHLPGCYANAIGQESWKKEFMGKEVLTEDADKVTHFITSERYGTLLEYLPVGKENAHKIYRCPSKKYRMIGSGEGSNGMFDYCMVKIMAGGMLSRIPTRALLYMNDDDKRQQVVTPLVVEESSKHGVNNTNIDPGWTNIDRLTTHHAIDKGFYCGIDGSIEEVQSPDGIGPSSKDWRVNLGNDWHPISSVHVKFDELPW